MLCPPLVHLEIESVHIDQIIESPTLIVIVTVIITITTTAVEDVTTHLRLVTMAAETVVTGEHERTVVVAMTMAIMMTTMVATGVAAHLPTGTTTIATGDDAFLLQALTLVLISRYEREPEYERRRGYRDDYREGGYSRRRH